MLTPTLSLMLLVVVGVLATAAPAPAQPGVTATEIKIGHTNPYSGCGVGLPDHRQGDRRLLQEGQ